MEQETQTDTLNMKRVELPKIDISKHVGKYADINNVIVFKSTYGNTLKVETEVIETIERENNEPIEIKATRLFSITQDGDIVVGSKLDAFLQKMGVEQPAHLIGKKVQLLKNEKDFLTF